MNDVSDIDADEAEIVRIMSRLPEFAWLADADANKIRHEIKHKIASTLHEYFKENIQRIHSKWTSKFKEFGISEDDGKTAISCARRLGMEI